MSCRVCRKKVNLVKKTYFPPPFPTMRTQSLHKSSAQDSHAQYRRKKTCFFQIQKHPTDITAAPKITLRQKPCQDFLQKFHTYFNTLLKSLTSEIEAI